jgi:ACDE family multidrug resistance protein
MRRPPATVLATAFATTMAFLGIGVIDPILPLISHELGASKAQVELLFTAYIAIMAVAMLVAGVAATRLGGRKTLLFGLGWVAICAFLCGLAQNVPELAALRAFWGFGNALFVSTALSIIVGASTGTHEDAITLYEAALGFGIATGPLIGGFLGGFGWRFPFFGTAACMAIGWLIAYRGVKEPARREPPRRAKDVFAALRHKDVLTNALVGLCYSYGFFTVLAYAPLALGMSPLSLGWTFFGWGVLVAFSSVVLVRVLQKRVGLTALLAGVIVTLTLIFAGLASVHGTGAAIALVVLTGIPCGIANTLLTTLAIDVSPFSRSISSGAYNFLRWSGGAVAPVLAGRLADTVGIHAPFAVAAGVLVVALGIVLVRGRALSLALHRNVERTAAAAMG